MLYWFDTTAKGNPKIVEADYIELIDCCFQYSADFSFIFPKEKLFGGYSWPFLPYKCKAIKWKKNHNLWAQIGNKEYFRCFFPCTDDTKAFLCTQVNDWFDWWSSSTVDNPEDPIFYRKDGSVFCFSIIHEHECYLSPHEDEDVSRIVRHHGWVKEDNDALGIMLA